jgi:hypothetical protein
MLITYFTNPDSQTAGFFIFAMLISEPALYTVTIQYG